MRKKALSLIPILILSMMAGCTSQATPAPLVSTVANAPTFTPLPPTATDTAVPPTATTMPPTAILAPTSTLVAPSPSPAAAIPVRKPDWSLPVAGDAIWSPLTVDNGVVYFGSDDTYLYAVDATAHTVKWKFKTGGAVRSKPAVVKDLVYIASDDSYVYAVAASTGVQAWKRQINSKPISRDFYSSTFFWFTSSPTIEGNNLYIGSQDSILYALDIQTGKVLWKFDTGKSDVISITPQVDDGLVIFGDYFGNFYGLNTQTGGQVWVNPTGDTTYTNGMTILNHVVYLVTGNQVYAIEAKTGKSIWKTPNIDSVEIPLLKDGVLYTDGTTNPTGLTMPVGVYDPTNGQFIKNIFTISNGKWHLASPVFGKNNLYLGIIDDAFYAIDVQSATALWMVEVKRGIIPLGVASTAAVADGMVYFAGLDGVLYAMKDE